MNNLLPIFFKIEDMHCLVIGGGNIALQKIEQLLDCKADVTVIAPEITPNITSLPVHIIKKKYESTDIQNSKLIIAATDDSKVNQTIYVDANEKGIPINVVDVPALCSFYMGSVFHENDLKIAISTNGNCPSIGTYLKGLFANMSKGLWGKTLNEIAIKRKKNIQDLETYSEKKEVMRALVHDSFKDIDRKSKSKGKVYLVGAGPGDPELITAKGVKAIQTADVIVHDALVHPYLVFELNPLAKKVYVGKRQDSHSISQENIHLLMKEEVSKGRNVVRLKGGDPFIFGRGGEEIMFLAEENIPFKIIPGITAGIGAAAEFGIPLTHRNTATSTLFITGNQSAASDSLDWSILAKIESTLVFYMGTRNLNEIVDNLMRNGKSPDIPLAILQNVTLQNQNIIISTIGSVMGDIKEEKILTPAIIIIGTVVNNYNVVQNYLHTDSGDISMSMKKMDFDYWKIQDYST